MGVIVITPGDRRPEDRQHAIEALRTGQLKAAHFVDQIVPFTDAAETYALLRDRKDEIFSAVYDWSAAE
jgi:threonine dehydrogenase-like Zn-dependent dehydrogenase